MTITYGSACSGIESASVAWEPLGYTPAWFSEIEPVPCAVLGHHWPHVANLGDMTTLPDAVRCGAIPAPDVLVGGTPCQAFSVAGKRESLADARGGLSLIYGDLLNALDEQRPGNESVCVWENVPGVLNTKDNAFGWLLGLLAGEYALADCLSGTAALLEPGPRPQPGKSCIGWKWDRKTRSHRIAWTKSGCVIGPKRTVAWRVLDAQYFGVAQRRRRVFVVASARKGFDPTEVLFEREGLRRDIAPSRETGQEITGAVKKGSHWDDCRNAHPTLNQSYNTGGIGGSNQELFSQRGSGVVPCWWDGGQLSQTPDAVLHKGQTMPEKSRFPAILEGSPPRVRRLTPIECERLQGFPENHTLLPYGAKQKLDAELHRYYERWLGRKLTEHESRSLVTDGPRYKAIGNSKAVPVVRWLGMRLGVELYKSRGVL